MAEAVYTIDPEMVSSFDWKEIPGWPDFKWKESLSKLETDRVGSAIVVSSGVQLAAYALPWRVSSLSKKFFAYLNPNWNKLDLIGGRSMPKHEWPIESWQTMLREAGEETGARFVGPSDEKPVFWLWNIAGNSLGPIFSLVLERETSLLKELSPNLLTKETATDRLLATLAILLTNS